LPTTKSIVGLVRVKSFDNAGIREAVHRALDIASVKQSNLVKFVLLKPNLRWYWDYSTGETTDPRVVSAIIDYVRERWKGDAYIGVVESDASAMRTKHAFRILGYEKLAREKCIELINLSNDDVHEKRVSVKGNTFTLPLPSMVFDCDLFINVPKLKAGPYASGQCLHMTCALKNLFGCISEPRKVKYHPGLQEVIVGVNKLIRPGLTVVDGVVALGKYPIRLGLIIAGRDNLAVESVAARVMGYDPQRINLIRLAYEEGVGNFENVEVVGESINDVRRLFPLRSRLGFKVSWTMQLALLRLYARISGDIIPPVLERM